MSMNNSILKNALKNLYNYFFLLIFFFSTQAVYGSTFAILPVSIENVNTAKLKIGKGAYEVDPRLASYDLSRALYLYLKAGKVRNVLSPDLVENAIRELGINPSMGITQDQLHQLAQKLDVDNLLLTTLMGTDSSYSISGSVYYKHADMVTDRIQIKGIDIWELLGRYLRARFQSSFFKEFASSTVKQTSLFLGVDARGRSYPEMEGISKAVRFYSPGKTSIVAVNGYGSTSSLSETTDKNDVTGFLHKLACKGHDPKDIMYARLLHTITQKLEKYEGERPIVVLIVSGAPINEANKSRVRGMLRMLSRDYRLHILGSARMPRQDREFWKNSAAAYGSQGVITYSDIIYILKAGLSSGHETYLFVGGNELYQNSIPEFESATKLNIPAAEYPSITPENAAGVFESFSGYKVLTKYKSKAMYRQSLTPVLATNALSTEEKTARVLLDIEGKPFWISIPRSNLYDQNGKLILSKGETYYFMLSLLSAQKGVPFMNDPSFALILPYKQISGYLSLDINDYLQNPNKYLNKSIGGSSVYILRAKVKIIRVRPQKRY